MHLPTRSPIPRRCHAVVTLALALVSGCNRGPFPDDPATVEALAGRPVTAIAVSDGTLGLARLTDGSVIDFLGTRYFEAAQVRSLGTPPCVIGPDDIARCRPGQSADPVAPIVVAKGVKQIVGFSAPSPNGGDRPFLCVLTTQGGVQCGHDTWGDGPFVPKPLDGGGKVFVQIGGGRDGVCGRTQEGTVRCWPHDEPKDAIAMVGQDVAGLGGAVDLAVGHQRCVRKGDGAVECWGSATNTLCVPGNGGRDCPATPTRLPGLQGVVEVAVTTGHTCVRLGTGKVRCWGHSGLFADRSFLSLEPKEVPSLGGAQGIAVGEVTDCAIVAGGEVKCWGGYHYTGGGGSPFFIPGR